MSDTISREAVADAINGIECTRHTTWYEFYQKVMTAVEKLPPIQPKRGKWNRLGRDVFNCNKCGATFVLNQGGEKMRFCPNCGAEMDEVTT